MIQTLIRNWWLLAVCGVLYAAVSALYLIMQGGNGPLTLHAVRGMVTLLGDLTLAAGVCAIAAGTWRSARGKCWLLVMNGLALSALGAIYVFLMRFPISFRTIALLVVVMAVSGGVLLIQAAGTLRRFRHVAGGWFLGVAGAASVGFALAFLGFVFRWIRLDPGSPGQGFLWLGAYFGFSAICMLWLAVSLHRAELSQSGQWGTVPSFGAPRHAH